VVTTLTDLRSIAEFVGGDKVSVASIATGYQNPHFVDPKPSYIISLSNADLFVTVGLDLETGWSPQLLSSSRNNKIQKGSPGYIDASAGVNLLQVPSSVNRAEGDIHIYGNPHYWLDPLNGKNYCAKHL
jgi:zinc/manganese transport system substrate-binding protein